MSKSPKHTPRPGPVTPSPPNLGGRVAARAAWAITSVVSSTTRWQIIDPHRFLAPAVLPRSIFVIWHNRQLLAPEIYRRFIGRRQPGRRLASIASASRDGAIAARFLELFDAHAVRGSSSRRGARALAELIELGEQGYDLAVTPDGPRGPRYEVKPGVVALAQHSGLPLVPISYHLNRKKVLGSWDRFIIPLPFGRCVIEIGESMTIPADLDEAGREAVARQVQERLRAITRD